MYDIHSAFIDWAGKYDSAGMEQRSRQVHEKWMEKLPSHIRIIKIEGVYDRESLVNKVLSEIDSKNSLKDNGEQTAKPQF